MTEAPFRLVRRVARGGCPVIYGTGFRPSINCQVMETARALHYPGRHGHTTDRRSFAGMAAAPPPEPARSRARGRDLDQAPELPGNRPRPAFARDGAAARRAARCPLA